MKPTKEQIVEIFLHGGKHHAMHETIKNFILSDENELVISQEEALVIIWALAGCTSLAGNLPMETAMVVSRGACKAVFKDLNIT